MKHILFKFFFIAVFLYPFLSYSEDTNSRGLLPANRDIELVQGRYYLLSIGIDNYINLPKLATAAGDAKEVTRVLTEKYGFDKERVFELYDTRATEKNIIAALRDIAEVIKPEDSLLIYYAGHGTLDKITKQGAWMPVDASPLDPTTWIENTTIKKYLSLDAIKARHILLISDSCFAGDFFREGGEKPKEITDAFVRAAFLKTSREAITSGGVEPVQDAGFSNHSVFSHFFLKALKENKETYLLPQSIHERIKGGVSQNASQQVQYGVLHGTGGEVGGSFVFLKRVDAGEERLEEAEDIKNRTALLTGDILEYKKAVAEGRLGGEVVRKAWDSLLDKWGVKKGVAEIGDLEFFIDILAEKDIVIQNEAERLKDMLGIITIEMVFVKGGCYEMGNTFGDGDADEKPVHKVCVDDFYIGRYEVTQGEWKRIMGYNLSHFGSCGDDCPVENISWNDTQRFMDVLNHKTGEAYRLPTEAEWEYAVWSVGKKEKWAGTNRESFLQDYAWYDANSERKSHMVGQKEPNGLGIYDMSGNVWEFVEDWYGDRYYKESPRDNPKGAYLGNFKIMRGGSWEDKPYFLRTAARGRMVPALRRNNVGFRLAFSAQ